MKKETPVILICLLFLFADGFSGFYLVDFWRKGLFEVHLLVLITILIFQSVFAVLFGFITFSLFKKVFSGPY